MCWLSIRIMMFLRPGRCSFMSSRFIVVFVSLNTLAFCWFIIKGRTQWTHVDGDTAADILQPNAVTHADPLNSRSYRHQIFFSSASCRFSAALSVKCQRCCNDKVRGRFTGNVTVSPCQCPRFILWRTQVTYQAAPTSLSL